MSKSKIDYLTHSLSIISGCDGCEILKDCYARKFLNRFNAGCQLCKQFKPHFHESRLVEIDKIKKPSRIGLNFFGDTFGKSIKREWQARIWNKVVNNRQHRFIVLTKQPQNVEDTIFTTDCGDICNVGCLDNLWVGVSITCEDELDRWVALSQKDFIRHKFISFEPLFKPLTMKTIDIFKRYSFPDWAILGALTGSTKVEMSQSRFAVKQTLANIKDYPLIWTAISKKGVEYVKPFPQVPIFVKNNVKLEKPIQEYPKELQLK